MKHFAGNIEPSSYAMEWRLCPRFPDYEVSEYGDIRRATRAFNRPVGYRLKGFISRGGYVAYAITAPGDEHNRTVMAYRLVAEAFLGPCPGPEYEVAHRSGSHLSAHYKDLRWATRIQNHADVQVHKTAVKGQSNGRARLTDEQAFELRYEYRKLRKKNIGVRYGAMKKLREKYGVSETALRQLGDGDTWKHLPDDERPL